MTQEGLRVKRGLSMDRGLRVREGGVRFKGGEDLG